MSEDVLDYPEDIAPDEIELGPSSSDGELVHWMEPKPLTLGSVGISAAALGGFALGVASTLAVLALTGWIGPDRSLFGKTEAEDA
jgi:hypothetical protein